MHEIIIDYLFKVTTVTQKISGGYFNKWVILKCDQQVASLWNASPTILALGAAALVICELRPTIQPVCELQAVS